MWSDSAVEHSEACLRQVSVPVSGKNVVEEDDSSKTVVMGYQLAECA